MQGGIRLYPSRYQAVSSYYAEGELPLVSQSMNLPLVNELSAHASFRRDEYKTVSLPAAGSILIPDEQSPIPSYQYATSQVSSNDMTIGIKYVPTDAVVVRASYGTGFLPPSLAQIASTSFSGSTYLRDPRRDNIDTLYPIPVNTIYGGNSSLDPEESKSLSLGLIFSPAKIPDLRVSVDYTRIRKTSEIVNLGFQQIIDLEEFLPGRVIRGDRLESDPPQYAGLITDVDQTALNIAASNVEAFDFQANYGLNPRGMGRIEVYLVATMQTALERRILPDSQMMDRVGYNDGVLKWRGNTGINWTSGNVSATLNTQFYDSYFVYNSSDDAFVQEFSRTIQGGRKVPPQLYTDVSLQYHFNAGPLGGSRITVGLRNVFNQMPPTIASLNTNGGYSTFGDPRLRSYSIAFRKDF
jgi:hypothetical protein